MDSLRSVRAAIAQMLKERTTQTAGATRSEVDMPASDIIHFPVGGSLDVKDIDGVKEVTFLAQGGYNSIWLVKLDTKIEIKKALGNENCFIPPGCLGIDRYVLRLPCPDSLLPFQITNEVALRYFVRANLPHIPVPFVYYYNPTNSPKTSYIVEEFIEGTTLSSSWMTFNHSQKEKLARKLTCISVDLAELQLNRIGGLDSETMASSPTVEGSKLFKGRGKFHRNECYPIGPYSSTKEYMLACYDKEIYYYSNASREDIDEGLFEDVSVEEFVEQLQAKRAAIDEKYIPDEPFVLVHGDFHGRNILVKGDQIVAVLDWEFAGSYPLSEALSDGGIDIVDANSEELFEENDVWNEKIKEYIRELVEGRGWKKEDVDLLLGGGNVELAEARGEMVP